MQLFTTQKSSAASAVSRFGLRKSSVALSVAVGLASSLATASAATSTWNGTGTAWNTAGDWTPATVPTSVTADTAIVAGTTAQTLNLNGTQSVNSLIIGNASTTLIEGGGTNQILNLGSGGIEINSGSGALTIGSATAGQNVTVDLNASQNWTNNSSSLFTVVNNITNVGNTTPYTLTINGTGSGGATISGVISDGGTTGTTALVVNATGTTTLGSAVNTYSGGTTLVGGTVSINGIGTGTLVGGSGSVTATSTTVTNGAFGTGNITLAGGTINATGTSALYNTITAAAGTSSTIAANANTLDLYGGFSGDGTLNLTSSSGSPAFGLHGNDMAYAGNVTFGTGRGRFDSSLAGSANAAWTINGSTDFGSANLASAGTIYYGSLSGGASGVRNDSNVATTYNIGAMNTNTTWSGNLGATNGGNTLLTKTGTGTFTITGAQGITGGTNVQGGTLLLNMASGVALGSQVLTLSGGTLSDTGASTTSQAFSGSTISLGGSTVSTSGSVGHVVALGGLTHQLGGVVNFTPLSTTAAAAGSITTTQANNTAGILGGWATINGADWATSTGSTPFTIGAYSGYTTLTTAGGGTQTTTNFALAGSGTTTLTGAITANSLKITDTGSSDVLANGGNNITFNGSAGGLLMTGGGTYTISGTGVVGSGAANENIFNVNSGSTLKISSQVIGAAGAGSLTKAGSGTLVLSGSNNYTGQTTIDGGVLSLGSTNAIGTAGSNGNISFGGGTLQYSAGNTGALDYSSKIVNSTGAISIDTNGQAVTFASALTATYNSSTNAYTGNVGGLTVSDTAGGGSLTLSAANTYIGTTTVNSGSLILSGSGTLGAATSVNYNQLTVNGGTLNLGGTTQQTGVTNFNGGTVSNGTINGLAYNSSAAGTATVSAILAGNIGVGLTKSGAGNLILSNANTFAGQTTISAGTVQLNNANALQNSIVSVGATNGLVFNAGVTNFTIGGLAGAANESLIDNGSTAVNLAIGNSTKVVPTYSGILSGAGATLTKNGTSTQILSGANTFTGGTSIAGGIINYQNATAFGANSAITVASGATAQVQGGITSTGVTNLTLAGTGANGATGALENVSGTNSASMPLVLTGNTTISSDAGSLTLSGGDSGAFNLTLASQSSGNGTLTLSTGTLTNGGLITNNGTGTGTVTISSNISSAVTGVVENSATSTLALSGTNAYTGNTTITSGTVNATGANALGATSSTVIVGDNTVNSNAALTLNGFLTYAQAVTVSGNAAGGTRTITATGTSNGGQVVLTSGLWTVNGPLTIVDTNASPLRFQGGVTSTSGTSGDNLTLNAQGSGAIDFRSAINNIGTITNISSGSGNVAFDTAGAGGTLGANVTGYTQNSTTSATTFATTNTGYTGTVAAQAGTIAVTNATAFGSANVFSVGSGATLDLQNVNQTVAGLNNISGSGGTVTDTTGTAVRTLTLGGSGAYSFAGNITAATLGDMALNIQLTGTGSQILSGSDTYTGGTTLTSGTLDLNSAGALGGGNFSIGAGTTIDNTSGSAIATPTNNPTITLGTSFTFGGSNNLSLGTGAVSDANNTTVTLNGTAKTLTLGGALTNGIAGNQTTTVNGAGNTLAIGGYVLSSTASTARADVINGTGNVNLTGGVTDVSSGTAASSLTYSGSGTLTFSGATASTYTGGTTVNSGSVVVDESTVASNSNLLLSTGTVTLAGGNLTIKGASGLTAAQTFGSIVLASSTSSSITLNANTGTAANLTSTAALTRNTGSTLYLDLSNAGTGVFLTNLAANTFENWSIVKDATGTGFGTTNASKDLVRAASTVLTATNPTNSATNFTTSGTVVDTATPISLNTLFIDTTGGAGGWDLGGHTATFTNGAIGVNGNNNYAISDGTIANSPLVLEDLGTGTLTISAVISGSSVVTQNGGNVLLSGANTNTNTYTLNGGTVQVGVNQNGTTSGAFGSQTDSLAVNAGTVDLNGHTVGIAALTGAGTITNTSSTTGTLTIGNGNFGYSDSVVIADGSTAGNVAIVKTGTGQWQQNVAITSTGGITLAGGQLNAHVNGAFGTAANTITVTGNANLYADSTAPGNYLNNIVINPGVAASFNPDNSLTYSGNISGGSTATLNLVGSAHQHGMTLSGNNSGFVGTVNVEALTGTSNGNFYLNTATAGGGAGVIWNFITGSTNTLGLELNAGGTNTSYTVGEITSSGTGTGLINLNSGTTPTLLVGDGTTNTATYAGIISGTGLGLTKTGTDTQVLTGTSTYTGATSVTGGTLTLGSGGSLTGTSALSVAASSFFTENSAASITSVATMDVAGTATLAGANGSVTATTIESGGLVTLGDGTNNGTLSGSIVDNGTFAVNGGATAETIGNAITSGTGKVTLASAAGTSVNTFGSAANVYSGGTTVTSGSWTAGSTGAFGTGDLTIAPTANVVVTTASTSNTLGSAANVTVNNGTGGVTGQLVINDVAETIASLSGNGSVVLNNSGNGTVLTVGNNSTDSTFSGVISDNSANGEGGAIIKTGTDKLTLSGANTYANAGASSSGYATEVQQGILNIQNGSALGTGGSAAVDSGATLQLQGGIAETGNALTLVGNGSTGSNGALENVSGSNSYGGGVSLAGATTIASDAGTLDITNAGGALTGSGNLTLTGGGNGSIEAAIQTGGSTLTKSGAGTWTLAGANTYTGTTTVSAGTLNVTGSISGSAVNVASGATLSGTGSTGFVTVSSGGSIGLQNGSVGTLTVAGLSTGGSPASSFTFDIGATLGSIDTIADSGTLTLLGAGGTTITIGNASGVTSLTDGLYNLITYTGAYTGSLSNLSLSTTTLDGQILSLVQGSGAIELQVSSPNVPTAYFNGAGNDLNTAANYDPSVSAGASNGGAVTTASNVFFSANRNASTTPNISAPLEVNSVNFGAGTGTNSGITVSSSNTADTLQIDATSANGNTAGSGITVVGGGADVISAPVVLGGSQSWNTDTTSKLTVSGQVSGAYALTKSGTGTVVLSNATGNIYTGGTTVNAGKLFISNTSGSATGTGAVTVNNGGTLAGKGIISTSSGVAINNGGSLASGARSQISGAGLSTVGGMAFVNTAVTVGSGFTGGTANLTFLLGSGTSGINGGTASGAYDFSNPNNNTTYLKLTGSSTINFAGTTSISLVDLTNTTGSNGSLSLRLNSPYLLAQAGSNADYLNLVINSGTDANPIYSLSQNDAGVNGYVVGVYTGGLINASDATPISILQYGADGVTPLSPGANGIYAAPALYLNGGDLEVVPEPGTWALMLGGIALLIVIQRRRNKIG